MDSKILTADVPRELADRVDQYAAQMRRSESSIVEQALSDWVAWEDEKERRTLEALEDVRLGRTIPHEAMVAWMDSLETDNPLPPPRAK
jgi:predicted transcriptional regulator